MSSKIKIDDVEDFYEPSDSDGEYTERERNLLKKVKNRNVQEESEEEILPFDDEDEDEEYFDDDETNEKFENDSDFDQMDDNIPDARAWGKKRKDFFSTDFVDQDYSSYNATEEKLAEQEESEARSIQQRMAKELAEADFSLNVFSTASEPSKTTTAAADDARLLQTTLLQKDLSGLSQRERLRLFKKDSPEFDGLVQDFEHRLNECRDILEPILEYFQSKNISDLPISNFVRTKRDLSLNYCSNIAFYIVLKAKRMTIKNHPLVKRLVQIRQILLQLDERYDKIIKPQLEQLLEHLQSGADIVMCSDGTEKSTKLGILKSIESEVKQKIANSKEKEPITNTDEELNHPQSDESADEDQQEEEMEADDNTDDRRQITYEMSKNKGLTPHRKKELRNPRVKHRGKYRKALIHRKGAVRTVRKETTRYSGEISGIKATTKKGIKIK